MEVKKDDTGPDLGAALWYFFWGLIFLDWGLDLLASGRHPAWDSIWAWLVRPPITVLGLYFTFFGVLALVYCIPGGEGFIRARLAKMGPLKDEEGRVIQSYWQRWKVWKRKRMEQEGDE